MNYKDKKSTGSTPPPLLIKNINKRKSMQKVFALFCDNMKRRFKSGGGFTLIEVMVTMTVLIGLMSILIVYNRTGQRIQNLERAAEKAVFDIRRAQGYALGVREFMPGEIPCAYGVNFVPGDDRYTIFADRVPPGNPCSAANNIMDPNETVVTIIMEHGIVIHSANISDVLFRPPAAEAVFTPSVALAEITFSIAGDPAFTRTITINSLGRIQVEPLQPPPLRPPNGIFPPNGNGIFPPQPIF
jgi:Tfp pilus assembly protein FimT